MATQKRRVVYLSDEEWSAAKHGAEVNDMSISAYIVRLIVLDDPDQGARVRKALGQRPYSETMQHLAAPTFRPVPKPSQRGK